MEEEMKRIIALILIILINISVIVCGNEKLQYWDNNLLKYLPNQLKNLRVIKRSDIKDKDNLIAFDRYNQDFIIHYDFNNNGKEEYIIPCLSKKEMHRWVIVILEKEGENKYTFVKYFSFNMPSFYIFKQKGRDFYYIRIGQSFASDEIINIYWNGKEFVQD